jgi:hypothetical protein
MDSSPLIDLCIKILCDTLPTQPLDAAYLFGQLPENQQSVLGRGARLIQEGRTNRLIIPDSEPRNGYPGSACWREELLGLGVLNEHIVGAPTAEIEKLNTFSEALAAARHARTAEYRTLAVIAAPFHQLRAFISGVSAARREYPELQIYSVPGDPLNWYQDAVHSQGKLFGRREEFIHTELERIERYKLKGDLLDAAEVLEYLRRRDSCA